jgi:hypothetical protein
MIMTISACSVEALEVLIGARRSPKVLPAAPNRSEANGISMVAVVLEKLTAREKMAKTLVEKMVVEDGVAVPLPARKKMAKAAVAANLSSRHHQALSPHPRELARKEAEAAEKGVEEEEAQARPGVEVGPAEVGTMEAEAQEAEEALVVEILVMETPADGASVKKDLALALALVLVASIVMVEEVLVGDLLVEEMLVDGILVIRCSDPERIPRLLSPLP